jgi:hypothetical protein
MAPQPNVTKMPVNAVPRSHRIVPAQDYWISSILMGLAHLLVD